MKKMTMNDTSDISRRSVIHAPLLVGLGLSAIGTSAWAQGAEAPEPAGSEEAAQVLARHVAGFAASTLPLDVAQITKMEILDILGIAVAGSSQPGVTQLMALMKEWGGTGEATMWGTNLRLPMPNAGQLNATMAHALDFDDVHERSFTHPAVICVPAALAAAEWANMNDGAELVAAIALGVDVICRLAMAGRPGVNAFELGWHNTTVYGAMAAALVAGRIMKLTDVQLVHAVGIAYHQSAGNAQAILDGALTKRMGPGFAVRHGLVSALLASKGVTGATQPLEGKKGFYSLYHGGTYSRSLLLDGLGERFEGRQVSFKPYPCCRGAHPSIDAALAIAADPDFDPTRIEEIVAVNGPGQYNLLSVPLEQKIRPRSTVDAQFSIPWVVALALLDKKVVMQDFAPAALARKEVLELTSKVRVELDPSLTTQGGGVEPARLDVRIKGGKLLSHTIRVARGTPELPITFDDCSKKFAGCALSAGIKPNAIEKIEHMVRDLQKVRNFRPLFGALARQHLNG